MSPRDIEFSELELSEMQADVHGSARTEGDTTKRERRRSAPKVPTERTRTGPITEVNVPVFPTDDHAGDLLVEHAFSNGGRMEGVVELPESLFVEMERQREAPRLRIEMQDTVPELPPPMDDDDQEQSRPGELYEATRRTPLADRDIEDVEDETGPQMQIVAEPAVEIAPRPAARVAPPPRPVTNPGIPIPPSLTPPFGTSIAAPIPAPVPAATAIPAPIPAAASIPSTPAAPTNLPAIPSIPTPSSMNIAFPRITDPSLDAQSASEPEPDSPFETPEAPGAHMSPAVAALVRAVVSGEGEPDGELVLKAESASEEEEDLELDGQDLEEVGSDEQQKRNAVAPPPMPRVAPSSPAVEAPAQRARARRKRRAKQWFEEIFDEDFLRTLPFLTSRQTEREVEFAVSALGLVPGQKVLDLGCGQGRHAMELARRGLQVTGLDLSLPLLIRAADQARSDGLNVNFVHGDMRELALEEEFDAACVMGTTFGFFDDDTNRRVAANLSRAIKPGGKVLIDVLNRDHFVRDLPTRVWWQGQGCVVLEEVDFNYFSSRIQVQRSIIFEDGRQLEQNISVRAYALHELGKVLHHAGFKVNEVSGGLSLRGRFLAHILLSYSLSLSVNLHRSRRKIFRAGAAGNPKLSCWVMRIRGWGCALMIRTYVQ